MLGEALSAEKITACLQTGALPVIVLQSVDSSNEWCRRQCRQGVKPPFVCFAGQQTRGRGRRGRHWHSPAGSNLYLSMVWHFERDLSRLGLLPLMAGLAVRDCLHQAGVGKATLKWPNDVLVNGRKIAGVLVETVPGSGGAANTMIIGVGLNVAMPDATVIPAARWTDLQQVLPAEQQVSRNALAAMLLDHLMRACQRYAQQPQACLQRLQELFATGQPVEVLSAQGERLHGVMLGISDSGECRVRIGGRERRFSSADISLRAAPTHKERALAGHR